MFSHILHPTDFSAQSEAAFRHALAIALAYGSELSIVHTGLGSAIGQEWSAFPRVRDTLVRWGRLNEGADKEAVAALGITVHKHDLGGRDPSRALETYASQAPCDLVVMATAGRDGVDRLAHPSTAEAVARATGEKTGARTLFLPGGSAGFVDESGKVTLKSVLVPFDHAPRADRAIELAANLSKSLGAAPSFHLLHVGDDIPRLPIDLTARLNPEMHNRHGGVAQAVVDVGHEVDADLIVMATHGHDGIFDALRGSTTEQSLRRAHRAVLAVPTD